MQRQQVDALRGVAARVEPPPQVVDERDGVAVEDLGERDEPREVGLSHELAVAELVGQLRQPAGLDCGSPHGLLGIDSDQPLEAPNDAPRCVALQQRRALERDVRLVQELLEVGEARVRTTEDRHFLERHSELADRRDDLASLGLGGREGAHDGRRAVVERRAQHLLGAAELRDKAVRQLEHLRRRAVVLLEPHNERVRVATRHFEQVLRARARERVDRLVVVADDAEVVALAEPVLEQLLLEQVDVLVLVDGECSVLRAEDVARELVALEELHGELEQVLEVDCAVRLLARLVVAVDAVHEIGRDGRLAPLRLGAVAGNADAAVLRPLDLRRQVARGPEFERRR